LIGLAWGIYPPPRGELPLRPDELPPPEELPLLRLLPDWPDELPPEGLS
jgi:hypothetical protein